MDDQIVCADKMQELIETAKRATEENASKAAEINEEAKDGEPEKMEVDKDSGSEAEQDDKDSKPEPEVKEYMSIKNPTRVRPQHASSMYIKKNSRYRPVDRHHVLYGILVLKDTKPGTHPSSEHYKIALQR